jgi:hypothetical protein
MTLQPDSEVKIPRTPDLPDFSLALGRPLFQIYRGMHPSGDTLELLRRRILAITILAWLPLLILSMIEGRAFEGVLRIPFLA